MSELATEIGDGWLWDVAARAYGVRRCEKCGHATPARWELGGVIVRDCLICGHREYLYTGRWPPDPRTLMEAHHD